MKNIYILLCLITTHPVFAFDYSAAQVRKGLESQLPIFKEEFTELCFLKKEKTVCDVHDCLKGDDEACLEVGKEEKRLMDDPAEMKKIMDGLAKAVDLSIDELATPEEKAMLKKLEKICDENKLSANKEKSCHAHGKYKFNLLSLISIRELGRDCRAGKQSACESMEQLKKQLLELKKLMSSK